MENFKFIVEISKVFERMQNQKSQRRLNVSVHIGLTFGNVPDRVEKIRQKIITLSEKYIALKSGGFQQKMDSKNQQ